MAVCGMNAMAQTDLETFQFVDKDGNVVADGSEITVYEPETVNGSVQINSGLFVKNTTGKDQAVGLDLNITSMDNGQFSCCFPSNCKDIFSAGNFVDVNTPGLFLIEEGEQQTLMSEWKPAAYGKCQAVFQLKVYNVVEQDIEGIKIPDVGDFKAYGPKVTINFMYLDPTGVNGVVDNSNAKVVNRYNAAGMRINSAVRGLNIETLSNGKTIKRIVK
mgnify:FL=1